MNLVDDNLFVHKDLRFLTLHVNFSAGNLFFHYYMDFLTLQVNFSGNRFILNQVPKCLNLGIDFVLHRLFKDQDLRFLTLLRRVPFQRLGLGWTGLNNCGWISTWLSSSFAFRQFKLQQSHS
jgi:hypothetical protein